MVVVVDDAVELRNAVPRCACRNRIPARSAPQIKFETGRIAGFDFGLKTFLTCSEGFQVESPLFLKQAINAIEKANRQHSRKVKGSFKREQSRLNLARKQEDVVNQRTDWFWKLAHNLTNKFDVLCFETLNCRPCRRSPPAGSAVHSAS